MKKNIHDLSRRGFLKASGSLAGAALLGSILPGNAFAHSVARGVKVSAHLWVYASKFPPHWDATSMLEEIFSDLSYAGLDGLEVMEVNLRHPSAVEKMAGLAEKYKLPVTGTSYGADMWDKNEKQRTLEDVELVLGGLHQLKGETFGISVGSAGRIKTEDELDVQAEVLKGVMELCRKYQVQPNLHNHTYEVENDLHDLKGTLARVPDIKLGPDLNWLIRGGVDPVWFINTYGDRMVYLHIRDQKADGQWTETVGEGVTDFPAIAEALKKQNYKGRAAIELAFPNDFTPSRPLADTWKLSRQYVDRVFGW